MDNSQFVSASLAEFMAVWNQGGQASLNLSTNSGFIDISFNLRLGQPGAPFSNSPSSTPSSRQRHRGPGQKERNRQRAARHQAAQAGEAPVTTAPVETSPKVLITPPILKSPSPVTDPVETSSESESVSTTPVSAIASSISPIPEVKAGHTQYYKCHHCDFVNEESSVIFHMKTFHPLHLCKYCNFSNVSSDILKKHIQSAHMHVPPTHIQYSLLKLPLKKKDFDYAHPPYDPNFSKCLLRGEGCVHIASKYFSSVKVVINHQAQDHRNIYTCNSCIKFIPAEEQTSSPHLTVGNVE